MTDIDRLQGVLTKLESVVAGVRPDQREDRTDCDKFTVGALVDHIVAFMQSFGRAAQGQEPTDDGSQPQHSADPVTDVHAAAAQIVDGWRSNGTDRKVSVTRGSTGMPGEAVLGMTLLEYVTHGTDLAWATGQTLPFSDEEYEDALAVAQLFLTDDYRGEGKAFGPRVDVPEGAPASERLMGFMGRRVAAAH